MGTEVVAFLLAKLFCVKKLQGRRTFRGCTWAM